MIVAALIVSVGAAILFQFCNKKLLHQESASTVITYLYVISAFLAGLAALFYRTLDWHSSIFVIGIVNALGAWVFLRALNQGLTKTILFFPLTKVVTLTASAIFLSEWKFFDPRTVAGFLTLTGTLATLSAILFFGKKSTNQKSSNSWLINVTGFIVVLGLVDFLTQYFASTGVPLPEFLFSWYLGALVGSILPRFLEKNNWPRFYLRQSFLYLGLSVGALGSLAGMYWALKIAPAALVFPIHAFVYSAGTVLMGLFLFKERDQFGKKEWIGIALGTIGTILIITGIY